MINWKIRLKNPVFIAQLLLAIFTPILAYAGLTAQDMTSWATVGKLILDAINNPYVLGLVVVSFWNSINDPTTPGVIDSERAQTYTAPGVDEEEYEDDVQDDFEEDELDYDEMAKADEIE